jgi:hypothetical protein
MRSSFALIALIALAACAPISCGGAAAPAPAPKVDAAVAAEALPVLDVRRPTADEAFSYLFGVLLKMPFYRAHKYDVGLPAHPLFKAAAEPGGEVTPADRERFGKVFREEVFQASAYDAEIRALAPAQGIFAAAMRRLLPLRDRWGFRIYPRYEVVLTIYGPGGSYDTRTGTVTLLGRSRDGEPDVRGAQTIVHEIVHLGIEEVIVQRFHLPHEVKERLVDRICLGYLGDVLAGYKAQPMGPKALDAYVDAQAVLDLPRAVQAFLAAEMPAAAAEGAR